MRATLAMLGALVSGVCMTAGCASDHRSPDRTGTTAVGRESGRDIAAAIALLKNGETDQAIDLYIAVATDPDSTVDDLVPFDLTEREFVALSSDEREKKLTEWMETSRGVRRLTRAVIDAGSGSQDDLSTRAVRRVGTALAESGRALIAVRTGEAILRAIEPSTASRD